MLINGIEVTVSEAIKLSDTEQFFLKRRENGLLLNDYQINVLKRNYIDYKKCSHISTLLFEIEQCLKEEDDLELEEISKQLSEMHYYYETHK